jgi:hypothetical protein
MIWRPKSPNRSCWFWGPNQETRSHRFWGQTRRNHRPWFWGQTKKPALLISLCMVHIAHIITRPLDHLAIEYPTYAWPSLVLCIRSPTTTMILVAARHVPPVTCTPRDKQTWFPTQDRWSRTIKTSQIRIKADANQLLITIKQRYWPLGFSIYPLMSTLITKSSKFKFRIQDTWSTARRPKAKERLKKVI